MSDATATVDSNVSQGIMDRLRTETRPHHDKAERNGFGVMVMEGGLHLSPYVEHLAAWKKILSHLESALRSCDDEIVSQTWHEGLAKVDSEDGSPKTTKASNQTEIGGEKVPQTA